MILVFGHIYAALCIDIGQAPNSSHYNFSMGGSATNQAVSAARSGAKVGIIGTVSDDLFGKNIVDSIRKEGIHTAGVAKSNTPTGLKTTLNTQHKDPEHIISIGANAHTNAEQIPKEKINERALLLIQNDLSPQINLELLKRAKDKGARALLTLTGTENYNDDLGHMCDIIIMHANLFNTIKAPQSDSYIVLLDNHGIDGAHIMLNGEKTHSLTAPPSSGVIDKTKSFDCFCGSFAACVQAGLPLERALNIAHYAALLSSRKDHNKDGIPYIGHIEDAIQNEHDLALKS